MALTDIKIKAAKAKSKEYKLSDKEGLCLIVRPSGSKTFYYRYRFFGKEKQISLGSYPKIPLAKARELANEARHYY